jgi:hypothetical protein
MRQCSTRKLKVVVHGNVAHVEKGRTLLPHLSEVACKLLDRTLFVDRAVPISDNKQKGSAGAEPLVTLALATWIWNNAYESPWSYFSKMVLQMASIISPCCEKQREISSCLRLSKMMDEVAATNAANFRLVSLDFSPDQPWGSRTTELN